jgi:protein tyrosine/serine phosphatase
MPSLLPTILNLRDVGLTINALTSSQTLQTGKLYRSARPDDASDADKDRLINDLHIKTIVDLRTKTEHIQAAQKHNPLVLSSEPIPQTNAATAQPFHIPGIEYKEINFNGWPFSRSLIAQLSWWDTARLVSLMAMGYRTEAIAILGENVMKPEGLVGLAIRSIDTCGDEVRGVFEVLAHKENYPVLLHCTQGKDRTGLVVQLPLMLLGVDESAIREDYMMSQNELEQEREERLKEIRSIGLTEEFADCDERSVGAVVEHTKEKYGSIEGYLEQCGVGLEEQEAVRRILRHGERR